MQYDFFKNEFQNTNLANNEAFVVGTDEVLSHKEVYHRFQKLKTVLTNLSFDKNKLVIIYGEKQANFPVAIISLFHLYIPFVGVDAIFPENRVKAIHETTQASVIINLTDTKLNIDTDIIIDKQFNVIKDNKALINKQVEVKEDNLCYVLFTSGSTGTPKGVQITRQAFLNFANWFVTWDILNIETVYMNQATFSFDVCFCDLIGAFHYGSLLVLNDLKILKDSNLFLKRFEDYQATTLFCTPSFVSMYLTLPQFNEQHYPHFKNIVLAGEELSMQTVKKIRKAFPKLKIINSYGPTEDTVVVTYIELTDDIIASHKTVPIGYQKPNTEILIQNNFQNPEEEGELIIVGNNVSIGYCNREDLNKEKFFLHQGTRAYKTGDAAYIKNNLIYFIGRMDNQIKLNGYRIELDEITSVLLKHTDVRQATILPLKAGNVVKKIIAFIVLHNQEVIDMNLSLKEYLEHYLPIYMIPSEIITLKELPINSNYKIDAVALTELYLNNA